jgi:hypothetical protein
VSPSPAVVSHTLPSSPEDHSSHASS